MHDEMQNINNFELEYYYDANKSLDINSIQAIEFKKKTSNFFTFGYIDGDTWFRLKVTNQSDTKQFIFQLVEPFFQHVHFYAKKNETWEHQEAGLTLYKEDKNEKNLSPLFTFDVEANTSSTIYIQLTPKAGKKTSCFGHFNLETQLKYNHSSPLGENLFYLFVFGSMFIIVIFNFFLFIKFHDTIYLYYSIYIMALAVYISIYSGILLHTGLAPWYKELTVSAPIFIIFLTLFSKDFLKLKLYLPYIHKILNYFIIFIILSFPYFFYDHDRWLATVAPLSIVFIVPLFVFSAIYVVYKGHKEATYYIPGIILQMISLSMVPLMARAILPHTQTTHYIFTLFSYVEILFFSFVLVNRFYATQNDKIKLQNELLEIQKHNEKILEKKVTERTSKVNQLLKEKEVLLKEVYHRVKNNFQMVVSLLWIENENKKAQDDDDSLLELINRIKSMALIHQYLLGMDDYAQINAQEYIHQINLEIQKSYTKTALSMQDNIDDFNLTPDQALALGIIVNELLTNAVKHFKKDEVCSIELSCKKIENEILLVIQDNGEGFDLKKRRNSFGLKLIKQFSKKLHASKSEFTFTSGTRYELLFTL
ncbi:MAG: Unknown protein [uncultured Sulfurovum sp.]|uniref:histidine kinase n=1 Tax=uncultured Sulfurovum sp. TaxID=269237 RepID=A0A6S6SUJ1_9BACT|nr:MAG: Unknown protein [uncultured Sulfurovum sp.]